MLNDVLHNTEAHTQMGIAFVYASYVYWKVMVYQNDTLEKFLMLWRMEVE